ncbi:MAG: pyroglutamyl-peptidase I family protein [Acidobacteriota bacterium]
MHILITGFEPFAHFPHNPSQTVVQTVPSPVGVNLTRLVLPVVADESVVQVMQVVEATRPSAILSLGLAAGRRTIALERLAVNLDDFTVADNAGNLRRETPIVPNGPPALWTRLPIRPMEAALRMNDIPVEVSYSAGTYLCNHLFYAVLHALHQQALPCRFGFVHLPPTPDLEADGLPLTQQLRAVTQLLEVLRDIPEQDLWSPPLP